MHTGTNKRKPVTLWGYEMTDTYGGDANYCWVKRGTVKARSFRGAVCVAKHRVGWPPRRHRVTMECGDMQRIDAIGAPVCMLISWHDDSRDHTTN